MKAKDYDEQEKMKWIFHRIYAQVFEVGFCLISL